jgi:protein SCO1/2
MAAAALLLWVASTLSWWAFAFVPLPAAPPPWLAAARAACFGAADTGLPDASGLMLLVLAPAMSLGVMAALWGAELPAAVRRAARSRAGAALILVVAVAVLVEASWVWAKVGTARAVAGWDAAVALTELPADYPRTAASAPVFTLVDQHGQAVSLHALRGRPVIVTFVFAHCETMCPLVVATLKASVADASVLLVTLDPWRDTVSSLPGLARRWELPDNFHVLSAGAVDPVLRVAAAYGVSFHRDERSGEIVHPGLVFVVDADGRLAYTFNNPPNAWVREALRRLG